MPGTLLIGFRNANGTYSVVSAANPLPVTGGGGGGGTLAATATVDNPEYTEGQTDAALSLDLDGNLRVIGTFTAPVGGATADNQVITHAKLDTLHDDLIAVPSSIPQTVVDPTQRTRTPVSATGSTAITVLAADADEKHVVTGGFLEFSAAGDVTITNDTTDIVYHVEAGEKWVLDDRPAGWWVTAVNEAWAIDPSVSMTIRGIVYSRKVT